MEIAYLSNYDDYTVFSYKNRDITFLTGNRLKRYTSIKNWKEGYLVVECENKDDTIEEDYIDLVPILKNLLFNPEDFLQGIEEVKLKYVD